jgi:hypothetical protein
MFVVPAGGAAVLGADSVSSISWTTTDPLAAVNVSVAPLRYSPTWLPPGVFEASRYTYAHAKSLQRVWRRPGGTPNGPIRGSVFLEVYDLDYPHHLLGCWGEASVAINGVSGVLGAGASNSVGCVRWQPDPRTILVVTEYDLGLSQEDLVRIARSVQPDPGSMTVPLRIDRPGILATTAPLGASQAGDSATGWSVALVFGHDNLDAWIPFATVTLSTTATPPAGGLEPQALTVGGRPARYVLQPNQGPYTDTGQAWLAVDVGFGVMLTVSVRFYLDIPPSPAELASVATGIAIGLPDVSWVGSRPG